MSPNVIRGLGFVVAALLALIGLLHLYWAVGGRWGSAVSVPSREGQALFEPSVLATTVVALLLFCAAAVVLGQIGLFGEALPSWFFTTGSWVLTTVFFARVIGDFRWAGLFKKTLDTDFAYWDTRLFVPLCAFLAIGCAIVALGGGGFHGRE